MERKRRLFNKFLTCLPLALTLTGCQESISEMNVSPDANWCDIRLCCQKFTTKSPTEDNAVSDINLIAFHNGIAEYSFWGEVYEEDVQCRIPLVNGREYSIYALANLGKKLEVESMTELEEVYINYSSSKGLLMSSLLDSIKLSSKSTVTMNLCRMMAKISIKIDRSRLSEDVDIEVRKAFIGNSPRYIKAIGENRIETRYDRFEYGYSLSDEECRKLNTINQGGISAEAALYMPENMQGDFPVEIAEDEEKVLDPSDPLAATASYIELWMRYKSSEHYSTGEDLIYRFYLGEGLEDLNVERNCHYHITVSPEDDGLSGSGWRVDKSGIATYINEIILSEDMLEMNYKGQSAELDAEIIPVSAYNKTLIWTSSDSRIASVSSTGTVTAVGEGSCRISCKAQDGSGCTAYCDVNVDFAPPSFIMYPGSYVSGRVGEQIHIWCEFFPPNAPFDPGYEELNYDRSRGIYDYKIDEDGHGVTLTLKKTGTGIVYMTAGDPINESGMTIIEVNP